MIKLSPESVGRELYNEIIYKLESIGIMHRIFYRVKNSASLEKKLNSKPKYFSKESKIQDYIGVRVVLYFPDDIEIVHKIISSIYTESSSDQSISVRDTKTFEQIRYNIIYKLDELKSYTDNLPRKEFIDNTFELQIRTVFSEGWHEVEHDLRYKFLSDWERNDKESRLLNGVYAALENNEWLMIKVFDELAYKHYKEQNWEAMLRQILRLKIINFDLDDEIVNIFNVDNDTAKEFFRINRNDFLQKLFDFNFNYPLKLETLIYFINLVFVKNEKIKEITPDIIKHDILRFINNTNKDE